MRLPSPGFLLDAFFSVCRRFPSTMIAAFVALTAIFLILEDKTNNSEFVRLWLVGVLGISLLTGLALLAESKAWPRHFGWIAQGVAMLSLVGYYFWLDGKFEDAVEVSRYAALLLMAHLFVAVAAYVPKGSVHDFWNFNKELFANFVVGAAFSLILMGGLGLAILAVDQLFDLQVRGESYGRLFATIALAFNTTYFLYHCPKDFYGATSDVGYVTVLKHLCKFILIPIALLYFVILYTYGAKVFFAWNLPRGWISSLVIGFSVAGIFTYLLNFFLPDYDQNPLVHAYKRWFWWVVLPLCALLFVAIAYRIGAYGITEERFLVAHMGIWLTLNCLYFLFSKKDNIKFIPISLFVFALLFAYGPFNAFAVSERNQIARFRNTLEQNARFANGKAQRSDAPMLSVESGKVVGALEFLERRNALDKIANLLPMHPDSFPTAPDAYSNAGRIAHWLNAEVVDTSNTTPNLSFYCEDCHQKVVDIKGFSAYLEVNSSASKVELSEMPEQGDRLQLTEDGLAIKWFRNRQLLARYDLRKVVDTLSKLSTTDSQRKAEQILFELPAADPKQKGVRLRMTNGSLEKGDAGWKFGYLTGQVFMR